jgi:hypothetical protein
MTYTAPPQWAPPAWSTAPAAPPPRRTRSFVLGAVAGIVVAGVVATVLSVLGVLPTKSDTSSADTSAIELPGRIDGFTPYRDHPRMSTRTVATAEQDDAVTAREFAAAHSGAAAAIRSYADDSLSSFLGVWAVRAATPRPVVMHQDLQSIGQAQPTDAVRAYGDAYCEVMPRQFTAYGHQPPPNNLRTVFCQRSANGLTVVLRPGGELAYDPGRVAGLTDEVWARLS